MCWLSGGGRVGKRRRRGWWWEARVLVELWGCWWNARGCWWNARVLVECQGAGGMLGVGEEWEGGLV